MSTLGVVGECMLEFRGQSGSYNLGYGGDVFNTAVYATRLGLDVKFFSATGDDNFSRYLMEAWKNEGVATETVRTISGLTPSLYIIKTDDAGERTFHYWREASPFKQWLSSGDYLQNLQSTMRSCEFIYYSGISLALLPDEGKEILLSQVKEYRKAGGQVGFDPNYRPRLWPCSAEAATWIDRAYANCDIAFPSLDDEVVLRGEQSQDNLFAHIGGLGAKEIVVKNGDCGATVKFNGELQSIAADLVDTVIDTTAAGDSFNGAYLSTRLNGGSPVASAKLGCKVAATVIQHRGAIISANVRLVEPS
ncbi:sugar kinase [Pseudomonadales bacterium]|nr:sugar kinase [Pseudomonadales bacterium]MDB4035113.1 sugar kinase [Pseudomonadales bacterium]MDC1299066.1 sugar kinase [Pseudomonadales bacterium]